MAGTGGTLSIGLEPETVPPGGNPEIPELAPGEYALLRVSDTGIGMDEETRSKIFDPYFSARQESGGTGLGLAIVHGVVTRHGGVIDVQSRSGIGTSFRIYLPLVAAEPWKTGEERSPALPRGAGQMILVVDDDVLVLNTVGRMLKGLSYNPDVHDTPAAAYDAFVEAPERYDAILADLSMPGETGVQFAERAREIRDDIPIAIMTGNVSALENADIPCISKPMQMAELSACLRELLGRSD